MTFLENFFLNYIPAFLILLGVLWYFGLLSPIGKAARKLATAAPTPTQTTNISALPPREIVALYAKTFLSQDAQARLADPINATLNGQADVYESLAISEHDIKTIADLSNTDWGQLLIDELHEVSATGVWLDWKCNVLTMLQDDDWDDQLGKLFALNGLPTVTSEERASILDHIDPSIPPRDLGLQIDKLQTFAEKRGHRLLVIHNQSDGILLTSVPKEKATPWIGVAFAHILISNREH